MRQRARHRADDDEETMTMAVGGTGRVALATATVGIDRDVDLPLIVGALRARGLDAEAVAWDTEGHDWSAYDSVVIRSTWDYWRRLDTFLARADDISAVTRLYNPAGVVRWNSDKRYLADLADRGVPTVPTVFIAPGEKIVLPEQGHFVVKPTVSAGSRGAARYAEGMTAGAERHVEQLHAAGETAMVQPYLPRIAEGERALVHFGGTFSHALRKGPVLTDIGVIDNNRVAHPGLTAHRPSRAEAEVAAAALRAVPGQGPALFARVDLAVGDDGTPVVMELELIEPNLFLTHSPDGLGRFADTIQRWTATGRP
ncbi:RimK family alpha-L-glutamate ligase [Streptomyces sp. NPDC087850]|uniref:ATP-grasp domain-containing protein n=1 Tax=Streptomyces sp. NPDC087850 TaxID=3365809 RepID=UPI0038202CC0